MQRLDFSDFWGACTRRSTATLVALKFFSFCIFFTLLACSWARFIIIRFFHLCRGSALRRIGHQRHPPSVYIFFRCARLIECRVWSTLGYHFERGSMHHQSRYSSKTKGPIRSSGIDNECTAIFPRMTLEEHVQCLAISVLGSIQ